MGNYSLTHCLVPAALAFATAAQAVPPSLHEIPLLDCSGLPCVELATASGKTLKLLIDLGSVNAYLDSKAAQNAGLPLQELKGGNAAVQETTVAGARLGDLPLGDFPFMVLDTSPELAAPGSKKSLPLPADGALAFGAFQNRLLQLDFTKRVIRVSEPENESADCPHVCGDLIRQRMGQYGPATLTATGFEVNGQPVTAQIDTLFTGTMLIYPRSVERLGLKKASKTKSKDEFPYIQSGLKLGHSDGFALSFRGTALMPDGPLYFWSAKEEAPPSVTFDATVGTALLSRGIVTFEFKGMHFWIDAGMGY